MAFCQKVRCSSVAEIITNESDYKTLCRYHSQDFTSVETHPISNIGKEICIQVIDNKCYAIAQKIQSLVETSKSRQGNSADLETRKQELGDKIYSLKSDALNADETECRNIMIRLSHWNSELELSDGSFERFNVEAIEYKIKMEKESKLQIRPVKIIQFLRHNKFTIEKWYVRVGRAHCVLKNYISSQEKYINFFKEEFNFICSHWDTNLFVNIKSFKGTQAGFQILTEFYDNSFELGLTRVRFKELEVWNFLKFVEKVMSVLGNCDSFYYLDPSVIVYEKPNFKLTDFKYVFSSPIKKYLSPEYFKSEPDLFSARWFSAGLIALEMLGCCIEGFNSQTCQKILHDRVVSLQGSQNLKNLLKCILSLDLQNDAKQKQINNLIIKL